MELQYDYDHLAFLHPEPGRINYNLSQKYRISPEGTYCE